MKTLTILVALGLWLPANLPGGTITNISFVSNGGNFANDTLLIGLTVTNTSPLAFTNTAGLSQPFLNAADSTISLGYGTYYAIAFLTTGSHRGAGTVSFVLDGATTFSQTVTFPDPALVSGNFATFALPGGDTVTISATGLSADRIRIGTNGAGLAPGGGPDAFYLFSYSQAPGGDGGAVPEPGTAMLLIVSAWFLTAARTFRKRHHRS
jgi:hypothetical protein